ncbi:UPF0547 protein C16orf87 homolog [Biomphalaria glabrata]|uniref:UPF0547 protein C16orf87 homolog n=1 Tax=Biomphalaria glabrata TaxID=6526 RepID=A0A9U8E6E1_BIOGL|nr:UPF0547 protein C16orf87 homolog [Biomphalaria glabrata]XP_055895124.1 UPF0547 protein C16orf87 homolog [Biomphalaria glabrata]XP_055895125.1 UPF0547 protein C16orf87 homolog [Biomphalaria glabrata]XP_055895126.1 UPF0547 protein C16orf87 homolog [Biomphalaria glabrata]XP_055895127.1 UPF0547 protein C16orf87 homolog [Biomphalaria glabrata]KAI8756702.1 putative UPF0547 protein C16orf87 isoform X2 [Biomphalaria glabrata]
MVKKMKRVERTESRIVTKKCPDCEQQCPVAIRACTNCSYSFSKTRSAPNKTANKTRNACTNQGVKASKDSKASTASSSTSSTPTETDSLDKVGRRFRTKRMRPDYFNSLELEYASRTFRQRKTREEKELKGKKKRGRPKGTTGIPRRPREEKKKEEEDVKVLPELDDIYINFTPERLQQFSFILDEINFKMTCTMFRPL